MDRRHRFCAENLSAYMDNALSGRDKQTVERHLAECVRCQEDLVTLRQTRALLRRAPMRPLPRSFTLPALAQPEQARFRRWTATYSFLRLATTAVTLLLVLLLSGDVLLSMGVLPVPDQSPPAHESVLLQPAAPAEQNVPYAAAPQPTRPAVAQAPLEQPAPEMARATEGQAQAEEQPAPPQPTAEPVMAPQALSAPQGREDDSVGAAQGEMAYMGAPAEPASPSAAMAPKRAAASPQEPALRQEEPQETAAGLGAGPAQAEPSQAPMAPPSPLPTTRPTAAPLPTEPPSAVAATPTSAPLAMEAAGRPTLAQEISPAAAVEPRALSPLWSLWRTLRLLWIGMVGLLLVLLAALLWVSTKKRA